MTEWHLRVIRKAFAVAVSRVFTDIKLNEAEVTAKWHERGGVAFHVTATGADGRTFEGVVEPQWIEDYSRWCRIELRGHQVPVTGRIPGEKPDEVWWVEREYSLMMKTELAVR